MLFDQMWEAAQKGRLILVEGGVCRWGFSRDRVITIYEIVVLPEYQGQGVGTRILDKLKAHKPLAIQAKCPEHLKSNAWYAAKGFIKIETKRSKRGLQVFTWRLIIKREKP